MLNRKFTDLQRKFLTVKILCLAAIVFTPLTLLAQIPAPKPCFDFTGTGRTSFAVTTGNGSDGNIVWHILSNGGDGSAQTYSFGLGGTEARDGLAPGYYDNDNRADIGVVRSNPYIPSAPITFYIRPSTLAAGNPNTYYGIQWGLFPDRSSGLQADYDGDGRDDLTIARSDSGSFVWYILRSGTNTFSVVRFGLTSDLPVTGADYNGDGRAEITVIRNINTTTASTYFAGDSNTGALVLAQNWGGGGSGSGNRDVYVIGDYLGDRRADFAVVRGSNSGVSALNATWYILENGGSNQFVARQFGYGNAGPDTDLAVCGDYNGDGKQDIAVYRQGERTFYWLNSPNFDSFSAQQWGQPNAANLPIGFLHAFNR